MLKKLVGLDVPIKTISGTTIAMEKDKLLSHKDAIVTICEMAKSQVPGETLKAFAVGTKIFTAKDSVKLTEEEFTILKKLINESNVFIAAIVGRLGELLDSAEDINNE